MVCVKLFLKEGRLYDDFHQGKYALRVMLDLAEHNTGAYIVLMDIAERQNISEKYLESIISILSRQDFVSS
jgi:DNA-binding IscR family transcriptional regulator